MAFIDDIVALLGAAGCGTYGVDLYASAAFDIPEGNGPNNVGYLGVIETGGAGPEGTHNAVAAGLPGYQRPNAQIIARSTSSHIARVRIDAAYAAVVKAGQKSQMINGVWWVKAVPLQEPFDFGLDNDNRQCYVFNVAVKKRPNAAMSA